MHQEYRHQNEFGAEVELPSQQKREKHVAHELVGLRACFPDGVGIEPRYDAEQDRAGGNCARGDQEPPEMRADRQGENNVGNRVTNVVEVGAEPTSDVQFSGQDAIEVVHEIVKYDQRDQVLEAVVQK